MIDCKRYVLITIAMIGILLGFLGGVTIVIDPLFHYHKPLEGMAYSLEAGQRYINDGITMNWDYDAVITGTSMTENFKPSEFDELFGVNSVKIAYSGASFYETGINLRKAFENHDDIKIVIRALDSGRIGLDADYMTPDFDYPTYLTDTYLINDIYYIFNKTLFLQDTMKTIIGTVRGAPRVSLDEFGSWDQRSIYGRDAVLSQYMRQTEKQENRSMTASEKAVIYENMTQNVISIVAENPETEFYFFFPPASIVGMDSYHNIGGLNVLFDTQKYAYELLAPYGNARVFGWADEYDMVCNLNNYKDPWHYSGTINSQMLIWMHEGYGLLTKDNYQKYFLNCKKFYETYNYDSIFQ